jgi:hypothetical protein
MAIAPVTVSIDTKSRQGVGASIARRLGGAVRHAIAGSLSLPSRLRRRAAAKPNPAAPQPKPNPVASQPPQAHPRPDQASARTRTQAAPAAAPGRPQPASWLARWLRPNRGQTAPAPARPRRRRSRSDDTPFTAETCPGLPPELIKLLNTPMQDCDPEALRLLFSAFACFIASAMPPGMAALGLTNAEDVFGYIQGSVGGVLDGATLASEPACEQTPPPAAQPQAPPPGQPQAPPPTQPQAPPPTPPGAAPEQQYGAPPAAPMATTPPATLPSPPAVPDPVLTNLTDAPPAAAPQVGPVLSAPEANRLPDGFLSILAAMFQDQRGSPAPSPASPLPAPLGAAAAPDAPGAATSRQPPSGRGKLFRNHCEHVRCDRRPPRRVCRRRSRRPGRCETVIPRSKHPVPLRRLCYAACAGPP